MDALTVVENALAHIYRGRRFSALGEEWPSHDAFSRNGLLPVMVAAAWRRYLVLHGRDIPLTRCVACGAGVKDEQLCVDPCPFKSPANTLAFPFAFEAEDAALLSVRVDMKDGALSVLIAMYYIFDIAQEAMLRSDEPDLIEMDGLVSSMAKNMTDINNLIEQRRALAMRATPAPALQREEPQHG